MSSRNATISDVGFGTSTPTAPRPGIGATMRMLCARIASARSLDRFAICRTFTPGAGSTSNCVTTGPVVRPVISAFNAEGAQRVRELDAHRIELALAEVGAARRGGVSSSGGGSSSPPSVPSAVASIAAAMRSSCSAARSARLFFFLALRARRSSATLAGVSSEQHRIDLRHLFRRRLEQRGGTAPAPTSAFFSPSRGACTLTTDRQTSAMLRRARRSARESDSTRA